MMETLTRQEAPSSAKTIFEDAGVLEAGVKIPQNMDWQMKTMPKAEGDSWN